MKHPSKTSNLTLIPSTLRGGNKGGALTKSLTHDKQTFWKYGSNGSYFFIPLKKQKKWERF